MTPVRILFLAATWAVCGSCNGSRSGGMSGLENKLSGGRFGTPPLTAQDSLLAPRFTFVGKDYRFGTVKTGALVRHDFSFVNAGKTPLVISDIYASCGCTTPHFDHKPVAPGATGHIQVVFDTEGKAGVQQKIITITANTIPRLSQVALVGIVTNTK